MRKEHSRQSRAYDPRILALVSAQQTEEAFRRFARGESAEKTAEELSLSTEVVQWWHDAWRPVRSNEVTFAELSTQTAERTIADLSTDPVGSIATLAQGAVYLGAGVRQLGPFMVPYMTLVGPPQTGEGAVAWGWDRKQVHAVLEAARGAGNELAPETAYRLYRDALAPATNGPHVETALTLAEFLEAAHVLKYVFAALVDGPLDADLLGRLKHMARFLGAKQETPFDDRVFARGAALVRDFLARQSRASEREDLRAQRVLASDLRENDPTRLADLLPEHIRQALHERKEQSRRKATWVLAKLYKLAGSNDLLTPKRISQAESEERKRERQAAKGSPR